MYLLDTNICIYLMKGSYPSLTEAVFSHRPEDLKISSITLFELEYGVAKSKWSERNKDRLYAFLSPFTILPFDTLDAHTAGYLRAYLAEKGDPIGPYDIQIAAQAVARDLTVVTHNMKEFSRVPGLKAEDWIRLS